MDLRLLERRIKPRYELSLRYLHFVLIEGDGSKKKSVHKCGVVVVRDPRRENVEIVSTVASGGLESPR